MTDLTALSAPFRGTQVSWRVGSTTNDKTKGMALAYIDARDVMERLDDVCGVGGWQCKYTHAGNRVICDLAIKIGGEWVWKANGAGDTDVEAAKGGISDAFKRAAVMWGVGRYLYSLKSPWVKLKPQGRSYVIDPSSMGELVRIHDNAAGKPFTPPAEAEQPSKSDSRNLYTALSEKLNAQNSVDAVLAWESGPKVSAAIASLPADWRKNLDEEIATKKHSLLNKQAAA